MTQSRMLEPARRTLRQLLTIAVSGFNLWLEHNAFMQAGALAFFTIFSLAPTLIIAVTVIGVVLGQGAAQGEIVAQLQGAMGAEAASAIEQAILMSRPQETGPLPTLIGIGAILIGATVVFGQLRYSMNLLWGVRPKPGRDRLAPFWQMARTRLLALLVVLLIGLGLLLYFVAAIAIQALVNSVELSGPLQALQLDWLSSAAQSLAAVLITALFIAALFKVLPDVLLSWRDVLPGALVTALLLTLGRYGIALYLAETAIASTYGAAASLLVILFWVYFSALLLLLGVALTRAELSVRNRPIVPRASAMRVVQQQVA
ncbi:MAG: YihY/virulence factor BrkB family protein [Lamprobacter sp.]|uniref:YihY/virulence factor BrkB family protein n=1 Tax=Lamprobacter sp. TaxID=3100796 RepID=UPI002B25F118|nr:YihY/virulence factor BrkB family protein [Lamprobacter sp.]MEA3639690.1 YihY/virulence factor BrkB family protein [Lamprobacter sp.]